MLRCSLRGRCRNGLLRVKYRNGEKITPFSFFFSPPFFFPFSRAQPSCLLLLIRSIPHFPFGNSGSFRTHHSQARFAEHEAFGIEQRVDGALSFPAATLNALPQVPRDSL